MSQTSMNKTISGPGKLEGDTSAMPTSLEDSGSQELKEKPTRAEDQNPYLPTPMTNHPDSLTEFTKYLFTGGITHHITKY